MSLDKAIAHGKERRRPYRGSARFDATCRPHGGGHSRPCGYCSGNRLFDSLRNEQASSDALREWRAQPDHVLLTA